MIVNRSVMRAGQTVRVASRGRQGKKLAAAALTILLCESCEYVNTTYP
jgi:hypothetical protein